MATPTERSREFFALHHPGMPFVLPCVWDVAVAQLLTIQGFPAIGTTSLGVAASHGEPDEARGTRESTRLLAAEIERMRAARLLSCDIEDGYSDDPDEVAGFVGELEAQGVNIEDSVHGRLTDPGILARKIRAVKAATPQVFVNARVDTFWLRAGDMRETRRRLDQYLDAGADGIFVPGDLELAQITELTTAYAAPLNVLASQRHPRSALADAGVARISTGSLLYRHALRQVQAFATRLGEGSLPDADALSYDEVQRLAQRLTR